MTPLTPKEIVQHFKMQPHPEGGHYAETYRGGSGYDRGAISTIHFLLEAGETSHWHRVRDAIEIWHYHAGAPLALTISPNGHDAESHRLGPEILMGQKLQIIVQPDHWQTATSLGAWTLVSCTVAPGFSFDAFELAPPDWRPTPRKSTL